MTLLLVTLSFWGALWMISRRLDDVARRVAELEKGGRWG